jgi:hypothetical protein
MAEEWKFCSVMVGKPKGKRPLGRPRHRKVDEIRMDLGEIGCRVHSGSRWLRIEADGGFLKIR